MISNNIIIKFYYHANVGHPVKIELTTVVMAS